MKKNHLSKHVKGSNPLKFKSKFYSTRCEKLINDSEVAICTVRYSETREKIMKLSEIRRELYSCKLNKMAEQEETADLCQIFTYIPPFSERALFSSRVPFLFPLRALEHPIEPFTSR